MALIHSLFIKTERVRPTKAVSEVEVQADWGILNDVNASPLSPRQVLITRLEDLVRLGLSPGILRENLVIEGLPEEAFQSGTAIKVGSAEVRLLFPCEPCHSIAHLVPSLASIVGQRGYLGVITSSGKLHTGDTVSVNPHQYPPIPTSGFDLFQLYVKAIPSGKVVTFKHLLKAIGLNDSYYRAIPQYIKKAANADIPLHRLVSSAGMLLDSLPNQSAMLMQEGILEATGDVPIPEKYFWEGRLWRIS